jgi:hypothetical protein
MGHGWVDDAQHDPDCHKQQLCAVSNTSIRWGRQFSKYKRLGFKALRSEDILVAYWISAANGSLYEGDCQVNDTAATPAQITALFVLAGSL